MTYAVTFDFHNTIARCDAWFELEVRGLLPRFLDWQAHEHGRSLDTTEIEQAAATYRAIRHTVIDTGLELTAEECVAEGLRHLGRQASEDDIARGVEELMRSSTHDLAPMPGAIDLIRAIQGPDMRLAIVSSAVYHPFLEWALETFAIRDAFDAVVTSASAGFYKSRTEIYQQTLNLIGVSADRAVHVGDSWRWDVGTAKRAGMQTVWYNLKGEQSEVVPDLEVQSLIGIAPAIRRLLDRQSDVRL